MEKMKGNIIEGGKGLDDKIPCLVPDISIVASSGTVIPGRYYNELKKHIDLDWAEENPGMASELLAVKNRRQKERDEYITARMTLAIRNRSITGGL